LDYARIYRELIADRRGRAPASDEYAEVHHILPRCMGGGNEPENLIRLTPEDHYFAHLLLAKVHGGKLASALWLMLQCSRCRWDRRSTARRSVGVAARIARDGMRGKWAGAKNPLFNEAVYTWWNADTGAIERATMYEMHRRYGGGRPSWTKAVSGEKPSVAGWLLHERRASHKRSCTGKTFRFVNRDGRLFDGTQTEFSEAFGINPASCSRVVRGGSVTVCGWRLDGTSDRRANAPKDGRRGSATGTGRFYQLRHKDGRTFSGTAEDFRLLLGKPATFKASVYLGMVKRGAAPTTYGWSFIACFAANATSSG